MKERLPCWSYISLSFSEFPGKWTHVFGTASTIGYMSASYPEPKSSLWHQWFHEEPLTSIEPFHYTKGSLQ